MKGSDIASTSVEEMIVNGSLRFQTELIDDGVFEAATAAVTDWTSCVIGAARINLATAMAGFLAESPQSGRASVFLPGRPPAPPGTAALINGTLSHALELDDIYAPALYHPGVCVVPAALACAQQAGASGEMFLRAVLAGYELSNRLGTAVNPQHYRYWHTTGTVGTFGAVIAASVALGLDARQIGWAIGNAASMAAGLKQAFASDGMTKPLHAGRAAEAGVTAALLARHGVSGASGMLTGPAGFAAAMAEGADLSAVCEGLFDKWTIMFPTLKRFASCGHTFAAVDAVLQLIEQHRIVPEDIRAIAVGTYPAAIEAAGIMVPSSEFEARFSIAFCLAAAVTGHDLSDPNVFALALDDPKTRDLSSRVTVDADPECAARFPALRGASVRIETRFGQFTTSVLTRKGAPENPLTAVEMRVKAERLIARGGADAAKWIGWCHGLRKTASIADAELPAL